IPGALSPGQYLAQVLVGGQAVARTTVTVVNRSPGVFSAFNPDGRANATLAPAHVGDLIQLYGTGQGPNPGTSGVADGAPASFATPAYTRGLPAVTIGGVAATVRRSALLPGQAGVWQVGVSVPAGVPTGPAVPVVVTLGSLSAALPLAIQ
ncbi:MAG TPA: hypothetical protein VNH18_24715, partial [Bryobacteraceae bacterium]|nr:hypothetical protein [Bryobacteraceae bacterium]